MDLRQPVLHLIRDALEWPHAVHDIVNILRRPLVTTQAVDSTVEIPATGQEDSSLTSSKSVDDVSDLLTFTVAALRQLSDLGDRSTVCVWSLLIKALALTCSPNCSILDSVPFILPRTSPSKDAIEGVATVLISHVIVPKSLDAQPPLQCSSEDLSTDYDVESTTEETATSSIDLPSIDLPFDAHIIKGRGRRFSAVLPMICVADEYNIIEVLTSVAYQRVVLGVDEPVIGMCFSKYGTVGRLVLGWVDSQSCDGNGLPDVHVAFAPVGTESSSLVGIFDLKDQISALNMAQFLLGLESHFHAISEAAARGEVKRLPWRCDHIDIEISADEGSSDERRRDRVMEWADGVDPGVPVRDAPSSST